MARKNEDKAETIVSAPATSKGPLSCNPDLNNVLNLTDESLSSRFFYKGSFFLVQPTVIDVLLAPRYETIS
jgi:hypothetical protein